MAVIENDVIKVTVSNSSSKNVIRVSPGVAALSSVSISLNELNNVDTSGITNGQTIVYNNGSFVAGDSGAVESINGEFPDAEGDVAIDFSVDGLSDVTAPSPSEGDILKYESNRWVNDSLGKADVGLNNVDNTSDSDKPVSTATQTALDAKANTSAVPVSLNDLSDVSIVGTPAKNTALLYDETANAFKFQPSFTNRFEDEAENNKQAILPFVERVYTVKTDGDGIFIDSQSDTPTAGKVIKRKIYHKVGFIASGDLIGDYTLVHTFADDIAYSATESVFEGFRDGDTYGTAPFTLIQTWEEADEANLLLDTYTGAAAAYSLRKLRTAYTGDAVEVYNGSSYADIGFNVFGGLNTVALADHCGSNDGFVSKFYDQSGNSNDAAQTNTANMPKIYDGITGVVIVENGKPAVETLNNVISYNLPSGALPSNINNASSFIVYGLTSASQSGTKIMAALGSPTNNARWYAPALNSSNEYFSYGSDFTTSNVLIGAADTNQHLLTGIAGSTQGNFSAFKDGALEFTETLSSAVPTAGYIGGNISAYFQEFVVYHSDESGNRTGIETNINTFYNIY